MKKTKPLIFFACLLLLFEQTTIPALAIDLIPAESTTSESEPTFQTTADSIQALEDSTNASESTVETMDAVELNRVGAGEISDEPLDSEGKEQPLDSVAPLKEKHFSLKEGKVELPIENVDQFEAALLANSYEDSEGTIIDYGEIDDDQEITLLIKDDLILSTAIQNIKRTKLEVVGNNSEVKISSGSAEGFLSFFNQSEKTHQLIFERIDFFNLTSNQDFIHTEGLFDLKFVDTSFYINGSNTSIQLNNQSTVHFLGETSISTFNGSIANLVSAKEVVINDQFSATIQGTGANPVISANQINLLENSNTTFKRTNQANTGTALNLTGAASSLHIYSEAAVSAEQTGRFVNITSYENSSFVLEDRAILDLAVGQGFSGNGTSYFDQIALHAGSQFFINEFGTVTAGPTIQAGSSFVVENGSEQQRTILKGKRNGSATNAFIEMKQANSAIQLGDHAAVQVEQQGPMFTGTATTQVVIGNHVMIENEHSFGMTGAVAVAKMKIGDDCLIKLSEPANATTTTAYSVFLARNEIEIGQNTQIDFKQTRTTATNALFRFSLANGQLSINQRSEITLETRGAFVVGASAALYLADFSKVSGKVGQGFTGTAVIKKMELGTQSEIELTEHATNTDTVMFNIQESFKMNDQASLRVKRTSARTAALIKLSGTNSYFQSANGCLLDIYQVGAAFEGLRTTKLLFGPQNTVDITSSRGLTGSSGYLADSIYSLDIGAETAMTLTEHPSVNVAQNFIRLRNALTIREGAELKINRSSNRTTALIRLAYANSTFTMMDNSQLAVKASGAVLSGKSSTQVVLADNTDVDIESGYGFTGNVSIHSMTIGKNAHIQLREPTSGTMPATSLSVPAIRVAKYFVLGENATLESTRGRTTSDSRFMRLNSANSFVKLEKNAVMKVNQRGGIFTPTATSRFELAEGATFDGVTAYGFTQSARRFKELSIQKGAAFHLTDEGANPGSGTAFTGRPMIDVGEKISVEEDATFTVKTGINRSQLLYFRSGGANLTISDAEQFELTHPSTRSGSSSANLQRLIRSGINTNSRGLKINIANQKLALWTSTQENPNEEFINVSGQLRINRNNGVRPGFTLTSEGRSRFIHADEISGAETSKTGSDIYSTIQKNNYRRLLLSKPEGLVARIDPLSDQSDKITGYMYEDADVIEIRYMDLAGGSHLIEKDSPEIVWGEYRDADENYRYFTLALGDTRLETDTEVSIFLSKPSIETFIDITSTAKVIKGLDYEAFNATLLKDTVNGFTDDEQLHQHILAETRVAVQNVLTQEDLTEKARVIDTNLTRSVTEDGTYYATIEVGHKAYQFTVALDVTSNAEQMRIVIPTKMLFESLNFGDDQSREFQSQDYQIRNQSAMEVATYVNSFSVSDASGVVLLEENEDPLDYAESEDDDENAQLTEADIRKPLIKLFIQSKDGQIQLMNRMPEKPLTIVESKSSETISLTGKFYGDYPQWVVDSEEEQGGYYEETLAPKYKMVLRFVPKVD